MAPYVNRIFSIIVIMILSGNLLSVFSQSKTARDQTFNVTIEIDKKGNPVLTSFHDPDGHKKLKAEIKDAESILSLGLQTATLIEGSLQVTSFASAGGLGSTRSGDGRGVLTIDQVTDENGHEQKCVAGCATGHKIEFTIL